MVYINICFHLKYTACLCGALMVKKKKKKDLYKDHSCNVYSSYSKNISISSWILAPFFLQHFLNYALRLCLSLTPPGPTYQRPPRIGD